MTLQQRTHDLSEQVLTDRYVAVGTLQRRYRIDRSELMTALEHHNIPTMTICVEAVHGRSSTARNYLIAHDSPTAATISPLTVAHHAGVAEMRLALGAAPKDWSLSMYAARASGSKVQPDALWNGTHGVRRWIEYDRGTYSLATVSAKLTECIERRHPVFWGDAKLPRLDRVQAEAYRIETARRTERIKYDLWVEKNYLPVKTILVAWHIDSEMGGVNVLEDSQLSPRPQERHARDSLQPVPCSVPTNGESTR